MPKQRKGRLVSHQSEHIVLVNYVQYIKIQFRKKKCWPGFSRLHKHRRRVKWFARFSRFQPQIRPANKTSHAILVQLLRLALEMTPLSLSSFSLRSFVSSICSNAASSDRHSPSIHLPRSSRLYPPRCHSTVRPPRLLSRHTLLPRTMI